MFKTLLLSVTPKSYLEVSKPRHMGQDKNQVRHERLIDFLNGSEQYKGHLRKIKKERILDEFHLIDTNELNHAVVVLTDLLNLSGGSSGDVDLYKLLQAYFEKPQYRPKFNQLAEEALIEHL